MREARVSSTMPLDERALAASPVSRRLSIARLTRASDPVSTVYRATGPAAHSQKRSGRTVPTSTPRAMVGTPRDEPHRSQAGARVRRRPLPPPRARPDAANSGERDRDSARASGVDDASERGRAASGRRRPRRVRGGRTGVGCPARATVHRRLVPISAARPVPRSFAPDSETGPRNAEIGGLDGENYFEFWTKRGENRPIGSFSTRRERRNDGDSRPCADGRFSKR